MNKNTKSHTKKIIVLMIIVMLCSFAMPRYSYAGLITDWVENSILNSFAELMLFIPDRLFSGLQDIFIGDREITTSGGKYAIKFSPGTIFAGNIPAFDINFIHPIEPKNTDISNNNSFSIIPLLDYSKAQRTGVSRVYTSLGQEIPGKKDEYISGIKNSYGYDKSRELSLSLFENKFITTDPSSIAPEDPAAPGQKNPYKGNITITLGQDKYNGSDIKLVTVWVNSDSSFIYFIIDSMVLEEITNNPSTAGQKQWIGTIHLYGIKIEDVLADRLQYEMNKEGITYTKDFDVTTGVISITEGQTKKNESTAAVLQNTVSTWYNVFRHFALVGLLSILVYISIRMIISSATKDKAKYKKMLQNWFAAICLLFILQFIISITFTVTRSNNRHTWKICYWTRWGR